MSILSTGSTYQFTLASGAWSGTDDANVIGNGSSTLTVTNAGISAFTSSINITDGSSGGAAVEFYDSGPNGYANSFVITLAHSTSVLGFTGASSFTGSSALTVFANDGIAVNSGASVHAADGAISLTVTGTDASITADGNVLSNGGPITLQATASVTVGSNVIVNSGTSTLTLAADVNSSGTGDDGIGTLTVGAGATVTSSNTSASAITLRGADVNIDTSNNPAVVGAQNVLGTSVSSFITSGLSNPEGLAFDSEGNLFIANSGGNSVSEVLAGTTTAIPFITSGLSQPEGLAFDASGNLYIANYGNSTISRVAASSSTALPFVTSGLSQPWSLSVAPNGDLYVANFGDNTVSEVPFGTTTPFTLVSGLDLPLGLTLDTAGNLYVGNFANGTVSEVAAGTTVAVPFASGISQVEGLAFDHQGDLYAVEPSGSVVRIPAGTTTAVPVVSGLRDPDLITFDAKSNLYIAGYDGLVSKVAAAALPQSGGVVIQSSVESRPMQIGGTNNSAVAGINLTSTELAQIFTTSTGTVTIGDSSQTGNVTFTTAAPITTAGATLNVIQSTTGSEQIILDDGAGTNTALNGNGGNIAVTAGTGGIRAQSTNNDTPEIATTGASVALFTTGPIGSSTNRIQFADNANTAQQIVIVGSTLVQPSSVYLDGLGNLTLSNILGNISNSTLNVTSRSSLTVASNTTIDTGTGLISLAADVNADGSGTSNTGPLAIESGADVVSYSPSNSAITRRGAAINIDTSADPGLVGANRTIVSSAVSQTLFASGSGGGRDVVIDRNGNILTPNAFDETVSEFAPGTTTVMGLLTGLDYPTSVAVDAYNDVFVTNFYGGVREFAPGCTTPTAILPGGESLAFDSSGNLFIGGGGTVSEVAPGSTVASAILTGVDNPVAMDFDTHGNLFVSNFDANTVSEFAPGSTTPTATLTGLNQPSTLLFNSSGDLFVMNNNTGAISEFAPGSTTPMSTLNTGFSTNTGMTMDRNGDLFVSDDSSGTINEFVPGATTSTVVLNGIFHPTAPVFDSHGNLFVGDPYAAIEFTATQPVPDAGGVVIETAQSNETIAIGGNSSGDDVNLTSAELAQIFTTSIGTVTIGDSQQTGNITFTTARPATTAGAALNVLESTSSGAGIILDDASGTGIGLDGNGGRVSLTAGTGGIQTTIYASGTPLATDGFTANGVLNVSLGFTPTLGTPITLIRNTAVPANSHTISGTFSDVSPGATVTLSYSAKSYYFQANYQGGDGNDLQFTYVPGPATRLLISSQPPTTVTDGAGFNYTVTAEDANGNVATGFTGSETVAIANNPGGSSLGGTLTVSASGGIASFSGLTLNKVGSGYTLKVSSGTLASATTSAISVTPGAATQLLITTQPPGTMGLNSLFGLIVTAEDAQSNVATSFNGSDTVSLASNPASGMLGGILIVSANSGVATFSGLTLNKLGSGYALRVANGSLPSTTSTPITVVPPSPPALLINAPSTNYAATFQSGGVAIENPSGVVITDQTNITGATVTITSLRDGSNETLYMNLGVTGLTSSYNTLNGTLTISGTASVATYQSVLETVNYNDVAATPTTATRNIQFTVTDLNNLKSNVAVATVSFPSTYTEASGPGSAVNPTVVIDSGSVVSATTVTSATVAISSGFVSSTEDILGLSSQFGQNYGITLSFLTPGEVVLTGSAQTTPVQYQLELDAITYTNTRHYFLPSDLQKTFTFTIFNGSAYSTSDIKTYNIAPVNTNPTVTTTTGPLSYTALSGSQLIDSGVTVSDPDPLSITSATVSISSGFFAGQDTLSETAALPGGVSALYNASTGVFTLTGSASLAQYTALLAGVTYTNSGLNLSSRTISFVVNSSSLSSNVTGNTQYTKVINLAAATVARFDFNSDASTSTASNAPGFIGVGPSRGYSQSVGYGFSDAVTNFTPFTASAVENLGGISSTYAPMYEDGIVSPTNSPQEFTISTTVGTKYDLRAYVGNPNTSLSGIQVTVYTGSITNLMQTLIGQSAVISTTAGGSNSFAAVEIDNLTAG